MHRFKPHAIVVICLAMAGLSAAPAHALPSPVDLPSPPAAQGVPAAVAVPDTPAVPSAPSAPEVEAPSAVAVDTPDVELPAAPRVEAPDVELSPGPTVPAVTDEVERTVESATGSDVSATVERVVSTDETGERLAETIEDTAGSVVERVDRVTSPSEDRGADADALPPAATPPAASKPDLTLSPRIVADEAQASTPVAPPASPIRLERSGAVAETPALTTVHVWQMPFLHAMSPVDSTMESDGRAAMKPAPAPLTAAYASGTSAAAGSSAPPSVAALLIALALLAPLTLFAFKEAPAFLRPAPFVALLERPG